MAKKTRQVRVRNAGLAYGKTGHQTLQLTVPAWVVRALKLRPGDEMLVTANDNLGRLVYTRKDRG